MLKRRWNLYWTENFGNPNALYKEGLIARNAVETARGDVAKVLGARAKEIIFTNGGQKAIIWRYLVLSARKSGGIFRALPFPEGGTPTRLKIPSDLPRGHIITTKFEHHAVLNACKQLEKEGFEVTYLDVGKDGIVNPEEVKRALKPETILVSIMYANNEIGTVQPIREIAKVIRNFKKTLG